MANELSPTVAGEERYNVFDPDPPAIESVRVAGIRFDGIREDGSDATDCDSRLAAREEGRRKAGSVEGTSPAGRRLHERVEGRRLEKTLAGKDWGANVARAAGSREAGRRDVLTTVPSRVEGSASGTRPSVSRFE